MKSDTFPNSEFLDFARYSQQNAISLRVQGVGLGALRIRAFRALALESFQDPGVLFTFQRCLRLSYARA